MDHQLGQSESERGDDCGDSAWHPKLFVAHVGDAVAAEKTAASANTSKNNSRTEEEREHASSQQTADVVLDLLHQPINNSSSCVPTDGQTTASKLPLTDQGPSETEMAAVSFRSLLWRHCFLTISYCCVFLSFGMGVAFLGPTLLDLGCRTGNAFTTMSWVFFSQTLFILVGSASGGWLASRFPKHRVLLVSVFFMAATLALIPSCTNLAPLVVALAVMGFFMGNIDTIANLSMIQLYEVNVGPFLQALHFFYGLGAFLAPMIVEPFLLNVDCTSFIDPAAHANTVGPVIHVPSSSSAVAAHPSVNETLGDPVVSLELAQKHSRVQYAFLIMALLQIPVLILLSMVVTREFMAANNREKQSGETFEIVDKNQLKPVKPYNTTEIIDDGTEDEVRKPIATVTQVLLLTAFAAVFLFLFDGFQAIYGSYVYSFAIKAVDSIPSNEAAYLNALFWGMFALGRLFSIVIATYVSPQFMLLGNIFGCLFGVSFLLAFYRYQSMLYTGTAIIGLFLSSVYPTSLALVENYISVTPPITTCMVVSAAAGEMFMPVIVGHEFGSFGPSSFLVNCLILTVLSFGVYFCLLIIGNNIIRYTAEPGFFGGLRAVFFGRNPDVDSAQNGGQRFGPPNMSPGHRINIYARMKSSESSEIDLNGQLSPRQ